MANRCRSGGGSDVDVDVDVDVDIGMGSDSGGFEGSSSTLPLVSRSMRKKKKKASSCHSPYSHSKRISRQHNNAPTSVMRCLHVMATMMLLVTTITTTTTTTTTVNAIPTKEFTFEDYEVGSNPQSSYCCAAGTLTEGDTNPDSTSLINSSPLCGRYNRDAAVQWDWMVFSTTAITDASLYETGTKFFYLDVYTEDAPIGTSIGLNLQDDSLTSPGWPNGRHSSYSTSTTTQNSWERLQFTFDYRPDPNVPDNTITSMVVSFDSGSFTSYIFYIDNFDSYVEGITPSPIPLPTASPTPAVPTPPTPLPPLPEGPFVTPETSSEVITIPNPPVPNLNAIRTNCPHWDVAALNWHDDSTWTSSSLPIPTAGADVTLPPNVKVLVNRTVSGTLGLITVPTNSELIFGEGDDLALDGKLSFDASGFNVLGTLTAGSDTCRLQRPLQITLHGSRPSDITTVPVDPYYKGISVNGGRLDLHGKQYYRTWTRLAHTVSPGDNYLLLQNSVNWEAGQQIVLVTTAIKDSREWHRNEVLTIDFIREPKPDDVGAMVYVTTNVQYTHIANNYYQGEVGLLSRSIVVRGSPLDSYATDPDPGNCVGQSNYGNNAAPCPDKELTGFGGHIMVHTGGVGYVEGVELHLMGQTNVLGRYPMHFHVLGSNCPGCYFRDSSVHKSFYRCISIHGTDNTLVSENVAYDVIGYCYYLEDGVEEDNTLSFNLAAHIHILGVPATGGGQTTPLAYQSSVLTLPADVTAAGYYITNVNNYIIGNAASGGWAGFAFPVLQSPLGPHKNDNVNPSNKYGLVLDGNTAHSTGWWWYHAGAFYSGGSLYYNTDGESLIYNAGRDQSRTRSPCLIDKCISGSCTDFCFEWEKAWIQMTNTKSFLTPSVGINSWSGRMDINGLEAHDVGLGVESLESGFSIHNMVVTCRTGESWVMPSGSDPTRVDGDGFFWYDTGQEHIITNSKFRNCGYRSDAYDQYDTSPTRGCGDDTSNGCDDGSTVFGFLTHSDEHTPEIMQGTKDITFDNCGRRFRLFDYRGTYPNVPSTVSGRGQNWMDVDGSVSGLGEPTIIGSGMVDAGLWWTVDDDVIDDVQGPLKFIKQSSGPRRGVGHIRLSWDDSVHNTVGSTSCFNGDNSNSLSCPALGYVRHMGPRFASDNGLPVTANPDIVGPVGGFGWLLQLNGGAPHTLSMELIEIWDTTPLVLAIPYPVGTGFTITANAAYCTNSASYSCQEVYQSVSSYNEVYNSLGNVYHVDAQGVLYVRIIQTAQNFVGNPDWIMPSYNTIGKWGNGYAIPRYERNGVLLPIANYGPYLEIQADCTTAGAYCSTPPPTNVIPNVCPDSVLYEQVSYDKCCLLSDSSVCRYAGDTQDSTGPLTPSPTSKPTPTFPPTPSPQYNKEYTFINFEIGSDPKASYCCAAGTVTQGVANVDTSNTINPSALVGQYNRDAATQWDWVLFTTSEITDASEYEVGGTKVFYLDVYTDTAPIGTVIGLALQNDPLVSSQPYPGGRHSRYTASTTTQGIWERLQFTYVERMDANTLDDMVTSITLSFDSGDFTNDIYYFDNFDSYVGGSVSSTNAPVGTPPETSVPTVSPTKAPTNFPSKSPTNVPTNSPTPKPTAEPTKNPTAEPTTSPTKNPTKNPTAEPTTSPTKNPTAEPTTSPTKNPTRNPTAEPTTSPTKNPTKNPTAEPTTSPTKNPTKNPTAEPTDPPTTSSPVGGGGGGGFNHEFTFLDYELNSIVEASYCCAAGIITENVANPDISSVINPSSLVGQYNRDSATQWDWVVYFISAGSSIVDASDYVLDTKRLYMDVYTANAPIGTEIAVTFQNLEMSNAGTWPDGRHSMYNAVTTTQNAWERLYLAFSTQPDPTVPNDSISSLVLSFDSGSFTSYTFFIDNLDSYAQDDGGDGSPSSTVSPTPKPTLSPTPKPTLSPTPKPTLSPTPKPTPPPTPAPTTPAPVSNPSPTPPTSSSHIKEYSFDDYEQGTGTSTTNAASYCCAAGTMANNIPNPDPNYSSSIVNPSWLCARYDRNPAVQWDWMVYSTSAITDASLYVSGENEFYIDIYTTNAPPGTEIALQLQDDEMANAGSWPAGRHSLYKGYTSIQNAWERIQLYYVSRPDVTVPDNTVTSLVLSFDSGSLTSYLFYIDNFDSYGPNPWIIITYDDFESSTTSGWGNFMKDPSSTDADLYTGSTYAYGGSTSSLLIQDNEGDLSSVYHASNWDVSSYSELRVSFVYYPFSMDNANEDFFLEYSTDGGTSWWVIESWVFSIDFQNDSWYEENVLFNKPSGSTQMKLRFRCDASGNWDKIYIDNVEFAGKIDAATSS